MDEETDEEIRRILKQNGVFEAHRIVAEYKGYRERKDGTTQEVWIRVYDAGPSNRRAQFHWEVRVPGAFEPEPINANAGSSIYEAGQMPHWNMLDSDSRNETNP